ncbi:hypothetical protein BGZ94_002616 [Podila epigama]|nr:hypothetical protein BGZ94_002616 [Podila epigama]
MNELKASPTSTPQDRKKMLGILDRFERQSIAQESLIDSGGSLDAMDMDPNNYASTPAKRVLSVAERNEILKKAVEEEEKDTEFGPGLEDMSEEDKAELERLLEQEHQDLVRRFQGIDLEQASFDTIWEKLTAEEKQEFQEKFMLSSRNGDSDIAPGLNPFRDSNDTRDTNDSDMGSEDEKEEIIVANNLLSEMDETMKRGQEFSDAKRKQMSNVDNPMLADLDVDDLKAIRDAEISELIPLWRPWWEIEAEEAGQLRKVVVAEMKGDEQGVTEDSGKDATEASKLAAVSSMIDHNSPGKKEIQSSTIPVSKHTVLEQYVLDEEAMLRPHRALVQELDEPNDLHGNMQTTTVVPMTKEPHPSLIYHVSGLLFAYVATARVFNGDLREEPEQFLAYIFDLCPFFAPASLPQSAAAATATAKGSSTTKVLPPLSVEDFETTLAVMQRASLYSKLWMGDTARLEMQALLLRDLTLILAKPSRCLCCVRELKEIFEACLKNVETRRRHGEKRLFSKVVLHRLFKKLEFYESYLLSKNLIQASDRLDRVRTEVVLVGIQVRQEMVGWTKELENVNRVAPTTKSKPAAGAPPGSSSTSANATGNKVLIEEVSI